MILEKFRMLTFFIENQIIGINPHDNLSNEASAAIDHWTC